MNDRELLALLAVGQAKQAVLDAVDELEKAQAVLRAAPPPSSVSASGDDMRCLVSRLLAALQRYRVDDSSFHALIADARLVASGCEMDISGRCKALAPPARGETKYVDDLHESAWGIIANALDVLDGAEDAEWRDAATRWRNEYHERLAIKSHAAPPARVETPTVEDSRLIEELRKLQTLVLEQGWGVEFNVLEQAIERLTARASDGATKTKDCAHAGCPHELPRFSRDRYCVQHGDEEHVPTAKSASDGGREWVDEKTKEHLRVEDDGNVSRLDYSCGQWRRWTEDSPLARRILALTSPVPTAAAEPVGYVYRRRESGELVIRSIVELGGKIDMYPEQWERLRPVFEAPVPTVERGDERTAGNDAEKRVPCSDLVACAVEILEFLDGCQFDAEQSELRNRLRAILMRDGYGDEPTPPPPVARETTSATPYTYFHDSENVWLIFKGKSDLCGVDSEDGAKRIVDELSRLAARQLSPSGEEKSVDVKALLRAFYASDIREGSDVDHMTAALQSQGIPTRAPKVDGGAS